MQIEANIQSKKKREEGIFIHLQKQQLIDVVFPEPHQ